MEILSRSECLEMDSDPIPLAFRSGGSFLDVDTPKASLPGSFSDVAPTGAALASQSSLPMCLFSPSKCYSDVMSATDAITNSLTNFFYVEKKTRSSNETEPLSAQINLTQCKAVPPLKSTSGWMSQGSEPGTILRGQLATGLPPIRTTRLKTSSPATAATVPRRHNVVETSSPLPSKLMFHEGLQQSPELLDPCAISSVNLQFPDGAFNVLSPNGTSSRNETASEFSERAFLSSDNQASENASEMHAGTNSSGDDEEELSVDEDDDMEDYNAMERPKRRKISKVKPQKKKAMTLQHQGRQACRNCSTTQTPQWREGPEGARTLCNACGLRFRKGLPLAYWSK